MSGDSINGCPAWRAAGSNGYICMAAIPPTMRADFPPYDNSLIHFCSPAVLPTELLTAIASIETRAINEIASSSLSKSSDRAHSVQRRFPGG